MKRGELELAEVLSYAQAAAERNAHKPNPYLVPTQELWEKFEEEVEEFKNAWLNHPSDEEHIRSEAGDLLWTVTMILMQGYYLRDVPFNATGGDSRARGRRFKLRVPQRLLKLLNRATATLERKLDA